MFRTSIQLEIISFLDCRDLVSVSQVNRSFYQATKARSIWQKQAIQEFSSETQFPIAEIPAIDWKQECLRGVSLQRVWRQASGEILTSEELDFFYSETIASLCCPEFVLPPLRRDINSFPTCVQDMLGNPLETEDTEYSEGFRQILQTNLQHMNTEVHYYAEFNELSNKIFGKEPRDSISTAGSDSFTTEPMSFALKFLGCLEETVSFFCRINAIIIGNTQHNLLEEYLFKWEQFSNSVFHLNSLLMPFAEALSEVLGRDTSILHFFLGIWRTEVYETLFSKLSNAFSLVLAGERQRILQTGRFSFENAGLLQSFVQSMCDLSFDENSVYFKNHSKIILNSAIRDFHSLIVTESQNFYQDLTISGIQLVKFLEAEHKLLENFALRVTCGYLKQIKNQGIQAHLFDILEKMYLEYQGNDNWNQRCSLNTPWTYDIVMKHGNPEKVHSFLLSASFNQAADMIKEYNFAVTYQDKSVDDSSIENIARHIGLSFEAIGSMDEDKE